jgi:nucleoside-specific outer membrane channel protein Tsx
MPEMRQIALPCDVEMTVRETGKPRRGHHTYEDKQGNTYEWYDEGWRVERTFFAILWVVFAGTLGVMGFLTYKIITSAIESLGV